MEKESKTLRYDRDVIKHSEENPHIESLAEWACEQYRKEFMTIEGLTEKLDQEIKYINKLKKEIKKLKNQEIKERLTEQEINWIKLEIPQRKNRGATFEGAYNYYINVVAKKKLNRRQFKIYIKKYTGIDFK